MARKPSSDIGPKLATLAEVIADEAISFVTPLPLRLEAFKLLTPYYLGLVKTKAKPVEEEAEDTFDKFTKRIADASS